MIRKLVVVLLTGVICLIGITPVLAQVQMPSPSQYTTIGKYEEATGDRITKFNESPVLRTMVAAGELRQVVERLPKEPLVMMPVEEIGQYGGTWYKVWEGGGDEYGISKLMQEPLVKYSPDGSEILPNIVQSWEISKEGKVFTFHIREGIKWSDGVPFTADDILFVYEDVFSNKELTPSFPKWLTIAGKPGKIVKIDDYTIRLSFTESYGVFLTQFVQNSGALYAPKHYLKQFHPRYTSMDKLEEVTKKSGFELWHQLYGSKVFKWWVTNSDYPTLWVWKVTLPAPAPHLIYERNPYYWKVDPMGNQLPYIDRLMIESVEGREMVGFKAMAGECDFQWRHTDLPNYTLYMDNREIGEYRVLVWTNGVWTFPVINLNQTCKDLVLRKLFQDVRFRQALSLGINREEINEVMFYGLGKPRQAAFLPGTRYYSEEWAKAYVEYDPKRANALLDEMGLEWDKDHEYRLRPDGKVLLLIIDVAEPTGTKTDILTLMRDHWENIGIKLIIKNEERTLFVTRHAGNEQQVSVWGLSSPPSIFAAPHLLVPTMQGAGENAWYGLYGLWYATKGEAGEEPTGDMRKLQVLWDKIKTTIDEKERDNLVKEIVTLHIKNIWMIGIVGETPVPVIVKDYFRNVPDKLNTFNTQKTANPEQFFIRQK